MAIESAREYSETEVESPEMEEMETETAEETTMLPITLLAGQKVAPGDVVRLEVVSVNDDDGSVEVKYATATPKPSAIDGMASKFKSAKEMEM